MKRGFFSGGIAIEAYSVAFLRWHRGHRLRQELNRLLRKLNCEPKAQLQRTAGAQLRLVLSQIAVAERQSPGDHAAALGVMVQLAAAVERRRSEMKKSATRDELADLPLRLVGLYLETRIAAERKQISPKDAEQIEGLIASALLKTQDKSGSQA